MMGKVLLLKFFFLPAVLLFESLSYSQPITWQRIYGGPYEDVGFDVCESSDGYFYLVGYTVVSQTSPAYILKLNSYGDTIWTRTVSGGFAYAVAPSSDGGCVFTGQYDSSFGVKLNRNGNVIWQRYYGGDYRACYDITNTSDGGYIACGYDQEGFPILGYILKIDSLGNLQWQRTLPTGDIRTAYSVVEAFDRGYVIAGTIRMGPGDTLKAYMLKIDTNGNNVWEKRFKINNERTSGVVIEKLQNNYLIAGRFGGPFGDDKPFFVKTDISGNIVFSRAFNEFPGEYLLDMKQFANRRLIFSVYANEVMTEDSTCKVFITDTTGNVLTQRFFIYGAYPRFESILSLTNGDILFVGFAAPAVQQWYDIYAARTDSNLFAPPIGIESTGSSIPHSFKLNPVYPNPFNLSTTISYEIPVAAHVVLKIYDLLGREVETLMDGEQKPGKYISTFSAENIASGLYFANFISGTSYHQTQKLILIK